MLETTLQENKLIKAENAEIRNQLTAVESELRMVKQKLDESLSRTITVPDSSRGLTNNISEPDSNQGLTNNSKTSEIQTAPDTAPIQSTRIDEVNSDEVPNFVTKTDEIEEISSDSSTIVEEPIKRRTGQPKPVMSDSDEFSQTPKKPTKKRAKIPTRPKAGLEILLAT